MKIFIIYNNINIVRFKLNKIIYLLLFILTQFIYNRGDVYMTPVNMSDLAYKEFKNFIKENNVNSNIFRIFLAGNG